MANPLRGQVALPACAALGGQPPLLCFDFDALCAVERALGIKVSRLAIDQLVSLAGLRSLIVTGLARHHGPVAAETAGAIVGACGRSAAIVAVNEALRLSFSDPTPGSASGGDDAEWDWWRCFEIWVEMGFEPDAFWRQTPRSFQHVLTAHGARTSNDMDRFGWLAWTTAALGRAKKMPRLEAVLRKKKPEPKRGKARSWQDQLAAWGTALKRGRK